MTQGSGKVPVALFSSNRLFALSSSNRRLSAVFRLRGLLPYPVAAIAILLYHRGGLTIAGSSAFLLANLFFVIALRPSKG